jgi:hypothetical protein
MLIRNARTKTGGSNRILLVAFASLIGTSGPVHADAIDGQWCLGTSHFEIDGPNIRTPGGNSIVGNYHRHGFTYVVPPAEQDAGTQIVMVLLNEETVQLTRGSSPPETWRRCKPTS